MTAAPDFDPKAIACALVTLVLAATPPSTLAPQAAQQLPPGSTGLVDGDAWDAQLARLNRKQLDAVLLEMAGIAAVSIGNECRLLLAKFGLEFPDATAEEVAEIEAALAPLPYWQRQLAEHHLHHHGEDGATS